MEFVNWLPSFITTGALGLGLFLGKNLIVTRLKNAVKHEYDEKLEQIKFSNRQIELELQNREKELASVREVAFSSMTHRQSLICERQLKAIDEIWCSYLNLSSARFVSNMMSRVKVDEVSKEIRLNTNLQEFFRFIAQNLDSEKISEVNAYKHRPFVSEGVWAYYSSYQSIVMHFVALAKAFENGLDDKLVNSEGLEKLIKATLPHQSEFIDKFGPTAAVYLLEEIEGHLLREIRTSIDGKGTSEDSLSKANEIISLSEALQTEDTMVKEA
ncbi:hypothetical protein ACT5DP_004690 [Vibrio alginolyticus]